MMQIHMHMDLQTDGQKPTSTRHTTGEVLTDVVGLAEDVMSTSQPSVDGVYMITLSRRRDIPPAIHH